MRRVFAEGLEGLPGKHDEGFNHRLKLVQPATQITKRDIAVVACECVSDFCPRIFSQS